MFCPNCGAEVQEGQKFCVQCGTPLHVQEPAAQPSEPEDAGLDIIPPQPVVVSPIDLDVPEPSVAEPEPVVVPEPEPAAASEPEPTQFVPSPIAQQAETNVLPRHDTPEQPTGWQNSPYDTGVTQAVSTPVDATLVSPIPQPVAHDVPMQGSTSPSVEATYQQPASYQQPSGYQQTGYDQGGYRQGPQPIPQAPAGGSVPMTPQVVPQATQKKPWYASTAVKILIGAVALAAVIRIGVSVAGLFFSAEKPEPPAIEAIETDPSEIEQIIQDIDDMTVDDPAPVEKPQTTITPSSSEYLESHSYPTLLAFMELSGSELSDLVTSNDYFFYSSDGTEVYAKSDGTIVFNAITKDGQVDENGFRRMSVGGRDECAVFVVVLEGFNSVEEVLSGVANCPITESKMIGDKEIVALVHGPSMIEYLVVISDVEDGDYEIDLYSPDAIELGFFDAVNGGSYGSTPGEVYSNYFG